METRVQVLEHDGQRDFDFFFGNWDVRCRRLRHPLTGSNEWYDFDGKAVARPVWGGLGNFDEVVFNSPLGTIHGATFRLYDPKTREWSIYWATAERGLVTIPTVGRFNSEGFGEFFDREVFEGKDIICRYRWTHGDDPNACRWEQAFSPDDGQTWETNWIMDFTRSR